MLQAFLTNWKERHRTTFNRCLHAAGIPMTVLALVPLMTGHWGRAALLFITGYVLQFAGHAREKTPVGEFLWIKRLLKK